MDQDGRIRVTGFLGTGGVARFALPERLHLIDALPMTPTGKVRKAELRAVVANVQRQAADAASAT
jgi:non-ribosomal peptide synthetase component E (peptide arylation enzyme)